MRRERQEGCRASIRVQLPNSNACYTEGSTIDSFRVSDFDQSLGNRLEDGVDLSGNSVFNSLKVSSQTISRGLVHIGTFDKLPASLDKSPLTNGTDQQSLQLQKAQSSNLVPISSGNTENQEESAMAGSSPRTDISTDVDTDEKNQRFDGSHSLAAVASDSSDRSKDKTDQKTLRRLAQNREAARKSRLRKKAYVQQLESSRLKLTQLEQELQRARQQGVFISSSGDQAQSMSGNGAMAFDVEYARWLEEQNRQINELRGAVNSHASDTELRMIIDGIMANYDEIFRLKGIAAKADVFHLLSGMWKTPAERCFLWLGGFRSSELLKLLVNQLEPLTEQQLVGITNLQQSSQQAEDALSQGMEALQQSLSETLCTGSLGSSGSSGNVANYMGQMAMAMGKLGTLEGFIRQVAESRCWSCGLTCQSNHDLQNHLHDVIDFNDIKPLWDDDRYLKPFMQDDSLLYSFAEDEEGEDEQISLIDEDLMRDLKNTEEIYGDGQNSVENAVVNDDACDVSSRKETASVSDKELINGKGSRGCVSSIDKDPEEGYLMANSRNHIAKHIKKANESYFGSYSSFGIHREMLSDKVRMDAYGQAILKNPSLLNGAVIMDVGCGTGILSLCAAQAGASRVIAVEASAKMATVASQVVKDNGLLLSKSQSGVNGHQKGVIEVVHGMVEEIDKTVELQPHSVDVLLSEWMGYCLLYESMLGSVLYARDRWLKPGGAILPDTATIFVAGFGKGGTSLPFWENVYDFDMSCIGKELVIDAAQIPIVDVVDHQDLVTSSSILQTFDLATMKPNEVDFTATASLEPKLSASENEETHLKSKTCCWCYGVVLWFETGFTSRFCREAPAVLSTSPYTPKTHWSQTILTFREPIAMGFGKENGRKPEAIGTEVYPAVKIDLRVSIVRSTEHRSIDISLEAAGVGPDGRRRSWPAQLFSLQ